MVEVDGLVGVWVSVCGDEEEGDVAEIEGPAAGDLVDLDIVGGVVIVGPWGDFDPLRGEFDITLLEDERGEVGAVENLCRRERCRGRRH